ncbi:MAG: hypothetical protein WBP12_04360 [Candidatus Saccharimonas sp.]
MIHRSSISREHVSDHDHSIGRAFRQLVEFSLGKGGQVELVSCTHIRVHHTRLACVVEFDGTAEEMLPLVRAAALYLAAHAGHELLAELRAEHGEFWDYDPALFEPLMMEFAIVKRVALLAAGIPSDQVEHFTALQLDEVLPALEAGLDRGAVQSELRALTS